MRSITRMIGAAMPMLAYVGSKPTAKVDSPISTMVTRKVYLRPIMSPRRPNTNAPNGRTRKPAAKAMRAKMKAVVSFTPAKNCLLMTAANAP